MTQYKIGDVVEAVTTITESGNDHIGDPNALYTEEGYPFLHPDYIHAVPGDVGKITWIASDGMLTVLFERTGTATILDPQDIKPHVYDPPPRAA